MAKPLPKRHRTILNGLRELGGRVTTQEIGAKTGLNNNGVSQSLSALAGKGYVADVLINKHRTTWQLLKNADGMAYEAS